MSSFYSLLLGLEVICVSHLHTNSSCFGLELRVFDVLLDDVLEGKHIPSVVVLWFDMTWSSLLHAGLSVVEVWYAASWLHKRVRSLTRLIHWHLWRADRL